jgi:hypothetical protein
MARRGEDRFEERNGWTIGDPSYETRRARQQARRELSRVNNPEDAADLPPLRRPQNTEEIPVSDQVMRSPGERRAWRMRHWRRPEWKRRASFKERQAEDARRYWGEQPE